MDTRQPQVSGRVARTVTLLTHVIAWAAAVMGIASGVALMPMLVAVVYASQRGAPPSAENTALYAAISALLAAIALGVLSGSLVLQRAHLKYEELRDMDRELVELVDKVKDNPEYGQCWGPRVSPPGIPEDLFYYTSRIITYWARSWRYGRLRDNLARTYAREFFKSEIPRLYWERYGTWHKPRRGIRRLVAILDEEYLHAVKQGPPARAYEAPQACQTPSRERDDASQATVTRSRGPAAEGLVWRRNTRWHTTNRQFKKVYSFLNSPAFTESTNRRKPGSSTTRNTPGR